MRARGHLNAPVGDERVGMSMAPPSIRDASAAAVALDPGSRAREPVGWRRRTLHRLLDRASMKRQAVVREAASKSAIEAERARMADEIHDGVAPAFLAVMVQARAARIAGLPRKQDVARFLDQIEASAIQGLEEARRSVFALRTVAVERDGLNTALDRLLRSLSIAGRTRCVLVNRVDALEIAPAVEDAVYRIVQEATQNALKHAEAREVKVELDTADGRLRVSIVDDGSGIPGDVIQQARERGGLRAMRDRAEQCGGGLAFEAGSPRGTRVTVSFPVRRMPT